VAICNQSQKCVGLQSRLEYHLTDMLFGQFTHCRFKPSGRLSAAFRQNRGLLEISSGGASLIVGQCSEQLGCEIQEDRSFTISSEQIGGVFVTNPPRKQEYARRLWRASDPE
jgi:hypothetical protein